MNISTMIKQLTESYKDLSIECVQHLCMVAGVEYRNPKEATKLIEDMNNKGYRIKVVKYSDKDSSVGQYVILTDLHLNVIQGYKIWIDFDGYAVRKENITTNEQVPFLKETGEALN